MAIVPEYGGPQVSPAVGAGANGFSFQAMQAPELKIGEILEQGVKKYANIQAAICAETDDAIATEAVTEITRYFDDLYYNKDTGFGNLRGKAATAADKNGKSPFDYMMENADKAVERVCEGKTQSQVASIKAKLVPLANNLYGRGLQHLAMQNHAYIVETRQGAINEALDRAYRGFSDPDTLKLARADIVANSRRLAQINGQNPAEAERQAVSAYHGRVLAGFYSQAATDPTNYIAGQKYLQDHRKEIDGNTIMAYDAKLTAGAKDFESRNTANSTYEALKSDPKQMALNGGNVRLNDPNAPMQNGDAFHYMVIGIQGEQFVRVMENGKPTGALVPRAVKRGSENGIGSAGVTPSMAKAVLGENFSEEAWEKIKADPDYNREIGARFLQLSAQKYGNSQQAVAAYLAGDKEVDDAIKAAEAKGGVWTQYLSKGTNEALGEVLRRMDDNANAPVVDEDGNVVNVLNPKYASLGVHVPSRSDIESNIKDHPYFNDLAWREKTVERISAMFERDKHDRVNRKTELIDQICTLLENKQDVPNELMSQLTVREQQGIENWYRQQGSNDLGSREYFAHLIKNPAVLLNMTRAEMRNASRLVPKGQRLTLEKIWAEGQADKEGRLTAEYITSQGGTALGKIQGHTDTAKRVIKSLGGSKLSDQELEIAAAELAELAARESFLKNIDLSTPEKAYAFMRSRAASEFTDNAYFYGDGGKKAIFSFKYGDFSNKAQEVSKVLAAYRYNRSADNTTKEERAGALIHIIGNRNVQFSEKFLGEVINSDPEIMQYAYASVTRKAEEAGKLKGKSALERDEYLRSLLKDNVTIIREFLEETQYGFGTRKKIETSMKPHGGH